MQRQFDPFTVVQQSSNRAAKLTKDFQEQNALDSILSQAMSSNDPDVLNQTLAKVISQVSPEKQAMAGQLIQNKMKDIEAKKEKAFKLQAAEEGGYSIYDHPGVQREKVKGQQRDKLLSSLGLGGATQATGNQVMGGLGVEASPDQMAGGMAMGGQQQPMQNNMQPQQGMQNNMQPQQGKIQEIRDPVTGKTEKELTNLTLFPETKNYANQALNRIENEKKITQKRESEDRADEREYRSLVTKDIYKIESEDLPRYKSAQENISHLKSLSKSLTGIKGVFKATLNTSDAAQFNTLGASLLEPVIKVFNPTGALPTAKLNWIKEQFQPRAGELSSTIDGKIATMERLNNQAIQRAEDKVRLFKNFNNKPPVSEIMKFDQETDKFINDYVDKEILKGEIKKETPKGKVAMLDPNGNPLHVDPNAIAPNGKSLIDFYIENGAKLLNE